MPPSNLLILASASKDDGSSGDEQNNSANTCFSNGHNKNALNASDKMKKEEVDLNGNVVEYYLDEKKYFETKLVWRNIIVFIFLHIGWLIGILFYYRPNLVTLFNYVFGVFTGFGITAGAHRLWAHGAFKANLPLRIFLAFLQTAALQNTIYEWVRDHRAHHKFTDSNADPHSAARGFFFSHMGWLMCKKHPDVKKFGKKIDMTDLERDPVVMFQRKYYYILVLLCHSVIPITLSMMIPGVTFWQAFCLNCYRYVTALHCTWLVNSWAHFFGTKPFDKNIKPADSYTVAFFAFGEGWHNYHHVFPYDYKTSEHSTYWFNFTTGFIDFMSSIGWATDLKIVDPKIVTKRALRTGDGSFFGEKIGSGDNNKKTDDVIEDHVWGWDDNMMSEDEKREVTILKRTETC